MSDATQIGPSQPVSEPTTTPTVPGSPTERAWRVRAAGPDDADAVAAAVRELLVELDGTPSSLPAMRAVARELIDSPAAGAVLVADADGELVGVLAASWQLAIHVPGSYALIQDLWVHRDWRGRKLGAELLAALLALARAKQLARVEVGLPRESFARFAATEAFYLSQGFIANGPRMRRGVG
jgi:GNAT superfamily N-acetyltransferase